MEGDRQIRPDRRRAQHFNPRPPCGGRRRAFCRHAQANRISIHALRVEGDKNPELMERLVKISIHALRVEGDADDGVNLVVIGGFQSTPSVWRATAFTSRLNTSKEISIHALRVEGDGALSAEVCRRNHFNPRPPCGGRRRPTSSQQKRRKYFNPRPPCGGRRLRAGAVLPDAPFQSTPSVWRATAKIYKYAMLCLYIVHIKLYIFATSVLFT